MFFVLINISCLGNLTMPWVALILAFATTIALSCFACAGYHSDNAKKSDKTNFSNSFNIDEIAKTADFIVSGYAFTTENNQIRVLNLNNTDKATVLDITGEVLMTTMDDIEISIVKRYFERNKEFLKQ